VAPSAHHSDGGYPCGTASIQPRSCPAASQCLPRHPWCWTRPGRQHGGAETRPEWSPCSASQARANRACSGRGGAARGPGEAIFSWVFFKVAVGFVLFRTDVQSVLERGRCSTVTPCSCAEHEAGKSSGREQRHSRARAPPRAASLTHRLAPMFAHSSFGADHSLLWAGARDAMGFSLPRHSSCLVPLGSRGGACTRVCAHSMHQSSSSHRQHWRAADKPLLRPRHKQPVLAVLAREQLVQVHGRVEPSVLDLELPVPALARHLLHHASDAPAGRPVGH
jgi:hypothetical protein